MLAALAGGVGAARFLAGLVQCVEPRDITVVVNTGDDEEFFGLHVSPDLDSVTYTLAGASNTEQGWGLEGESFRTMQALARYGEPAWFNLGDLDLATHIFRTRRMRGDGASLAEVTGDITAGVGPRTAAAADDERPRANPHHVPTTRRHARGTRDAGVVRARARRASGARGRFRRRGRPHNQHPACWMRSRPPTRS